VKGSQESLGNMVASWRVLVAVVWFLEHNNWMFRRCCLMHRTRSDLICHLM